MSALTLTGAIPGLLRRGSPVWCPCRARPVHDVSPEPCVVTATTPEGKVYAAASAYTIWRQPHPYEPGEVILDLTDPTGRYHALLWLRERGYDLRWAENEPEVLAWSVLSVARGGGILRGVDETMWRPTRDGEHARGGSGKSPLRVAGSRGWLFYGSMNPLERHTLSGPETGDLGRAAADRAALAAGYAIRNPDGLVLPELPALEAAPVTA